jgi:hypothetical protein
VAGINFCNQAITPTTRSLSVTAIYQQVLALLGDNSSMSASLDSVRAILVDWQNNSQQVEVKIWSYGISVILRGVLVRCDQQMLVIADAQTNFQLNFDAVGETSSATNDSVQLELSMGLSILIYKTLTRETF